MGTYSGIRVQQIMGYVILFKFENEKDHKDVMDWSPWEIQGNCISLNRWQQGMRICGIEFNTIQFWVQIHGLEFNKLTSKTPRE